MRCATFRTLSRVSWRPRTAAVRCQATLVSIRDDVVEKRKSAVEITQSYLESLERTDADVGPFLHVNAENALKQAAAVDAKVAAQQPVGPLAGVPIGVKDNICTRGMPTTCGSNMLAGHMPWYDATAVSRLYAADAVIIGKTNLDEFGMGSTTENSAFKTTRNAWDPAYVPGGSSGGSAAAVASGVAAAALGSDTGGSVRLPASFNGCVGLKPSYGRVSRYGLVAFASSLECIGTLTSTVRDAAEVLEVIAGHDAADSTSMRTAVPSIAASLPLAEQLPERPFEGLTVGVVHEAFGEGVSQCVHDSLKAACDHFEALGAGVEEVSITSFHAGLPAYYIIAMCEASSNLSRFDGVRYGLREAASDLKEMYCKSRAQGLGPEVKRRILMGTYALSAGYQDQYYKQAQWVRAMIRKDLDYALDMFDVLLTPVAATAAYKFHEKSDPLSMYLGDLMTVNSNLAGLPAVTLNCGFDTAESGAKLPIGMQLLGKAFGEDKLLEVAHKFQMTYEDATVMPRVL